MKGRDWINLFKKPQLVEAILIVFIYGVMLVTLYSSRVIESSLSTIGCALISAVVLLVFLSVRRVLK